MQGTMGMEKRGSKVFPIVPRATANFRFAIFIGVPCGGLYGGERARKQQRENKVCLSINDQIRKIWSSTLRSILARLVTSLHL